MDTDLNAQVQDHLQTERFLRERLHPQPGDAAYLHLKDLRIALESFRTDAAISVLDFGCGCSPYRSLFPKADYHRADFEGYKDIDYIITDAGRINAPDATFDLVLSTQVLEHVADVPTYLEECFRVAKPGARLVFSTHGTFEDHACPYDFNRWTALGLRLEIECAGFQVDRVEKLTTGPRAVIFCIDHFLPKMLLPNRSLFGLAMRILRRLWLYARRPIQRQSDRYLAEHQVASESDPGHSFYIAVLVEARKPMP